MASSYIAVSMDPQGITVHKDHKDQRNWTLLPV